MDSWKQERINIVKEFLKGKDYIILRGTKSWNKDSDIDVLCPEFNQQEALKRYIYKEVKLDIFTIYKIKKITIKYVDLNKYKNSSTDELDPNIEAILFFLKDYVHFSKYRKHKHQLYTTPDINKGFIEEIKCPKILIPLLKPSSNFVSFLVRSFCVKCVYQIKFFAT